MTHVLIFTMRACPISDSENCDNNKVSHDFLHTPIPNFQNKLPKIYQQEKWCLHFIVDLTQTTNVMYMGVTRSWHINANILV